MTRKVAGWIEESVTPSAMEVARILDPLDPELLEDCVDATRPGAWETIGLVERHEAFFHRRGARVRRQRWGAMGLVAAGAAALFAYVALAPVPFGPVDLPVGQETWIGSSQVAHLGHAIELAGVGRVRVNNADRRGTEVELFEGRLFVEVDPEATYRALTVRAGEVEVMVAGTRFEVSRFDQSVYVQVDRGEVEVRHEGRRLDVSAGHTHRFWMEDVTAGAVVSSDGDDSVAEVSPEQVAKHTFVEPVVAPQLPSPPAADAGQTDEPESPEYSSEAVAYTSILDLMDQDAPAPRIVAELEQFLDAYPRSSHLHEAEFWRFYYLAESDDPRKTVLEIEAYLARNPGAQRRVDIQFIHATLARDRLKDCQRALPSYRDVAGYGAGEQRAVALAYQGLCAGALGRTTEARWALERALGEERLVDGLEEQVRAALADLP